MTDIEVARQQEQQRLDALKTAYERNRTGQFATPFPLAYEITNYIRELRGSEPDPIRFLEPSLGAGVFYSALLRAFPATELSEAVGIEIDPHIASVAHRLWSDKGLRVIEGDFTQLSPTGSYNLVLTNPPYVRHHHLSAPQKSTLQSRVQALIGYRLHGLAGLYCYFLLLAHGWLADKGLAGWLIPSEFMDVNYGATLRRYLSERVTLLHVHRARPDEPQFNEALVSSSIVIYRKTPPPSHHQVRFSLGGTPTTPIEEQFVPVEVLRTHRKWTQVPIQRVKPYVARGKSLTFLGDLFEIKRGIATGANGFFILPREEASKRGLPEHFLRPILPSPRYLHEAIIESDEDGFPKLARQQVLLDCSLPLERLRDDYPSLAAYLEEGQAKGLHKRYLAAKRTPWYRQEQRPIAPFLCTYMGRNLEARGPFRFFWNQSQALAPNVYLLLCPRPGLAELLRVRPELHSEVFTRLQHIDLTRLVEEGRVYGGALHKIEPRELERVPLEGLEVLFRTIRQLTLF